MTEISIAYQFGVVTGIGMTIVFFLLAGILILTIKD